MFRLDCLARLCRMSYRLLPINLYIIINQSKEQLCNSKNVEESWDAIINNIEFISIMKSKMKEYPSITNKTIFKHMDMLEEIKDS